MCRGHLCELWCQTQRTIYESYRLSISSLVPSSALFLLFGGFVMLGGCDSSPLSVDNRASLPKTPPRKLTGNRIDKGTARIITAGTPRPRSKKLRIALIGAREEALEKKLV